MLAATYVPRASESFGRLWALTAATTPCKQMSFPFNTSPGDRPPKSLHPNHSAPNPKQMSFPFNTSAGDRPSKSLHPNHSAPNPKQIMNKHIVKQMSVQFNTSAGDRPLKNDKLAILSWRLKTSFNLRSLYSRDKALRSPRREACGPACSPLVMLFGFGFMVQGFGFREACGPACSPLVMLLGLWLWFRV